MPKRMLHRTFDVDPAQLARLRALSEHTRVPVSVYVREGLDRVLELAETQQRTLEAALARREAPDD